ncbi:NAD(P)/FAD-dependent oxidoreductase [Rhodococcus globerulus]|uniref:FAD-dependent oxidoreductase n=1 Tax=Rhodococcus globerulus TaxID=33008 RepID=A0ABU4BSS5_RHOGO|nr:FAD-dependent oxidoreductase [Rhodococcus globerulus]MDV6267280.1 FAD-dependent oxidoreductase [Rhodococcus globerulus]
MNSGGRSSVKRSSDKRKVAVVGSGVAGLTAAWVLSKDSDVTLYEADSRLGGHADTHAVTDPEGRNFAVDTGFIVHNDRTYPTLLRLFAELGVVTQESDMSMSVRCEVCGLEYSGGQGLRGVLPTPGLLVNGSFLSMLMEVKRFHRRARALLEQPEDSTASTASTLDQTLGVFLRNGRFSDYFTAHFMTPLVSAVWSCDPSAALEYPARYLFAFLDHHGMLTISGSPTWRTVTGGSVEYVKAVAQSISAVRLNTPVHAVYRHGDSVEIRGGDDRLETYDAVVIATHPQQALKILADPTATEHEVLGAMPYSINHTQLHTDETVLPDNSNARASWNYYLPHCDARPDHVLVSYDMTRLQRLPETGRRYIVTLGGKDMIAADSVIDQMTYEHPQYTPTSVAAQSRLPELDSDVLAFAGAYHGWGFHEDGALSGLRAAERVGGRWQ